MSMTRFMEAQSLKGRRRIRAKQILRELLSYEFTDLWDRYHDQPARYAWAIRICRGEL